MSKTSNHRISRRPLGPLRAASKDNGARDRHPVGSEMRLGAGSHAATVADVARRYLRSYVAVNCKPKTMELYRTVIDNHIVPRPGRAAHRRGSAQRRDGAAPRAARSSGRGEQRPAGVVAALPQGPAVGARARGRQSLPIRSQVQTAPAQPAISPVTNTGAWARRCATARPTAWSLRRPPRPCAFSS